MVQPGNGLRLDSFTLSPAINVDCAHTYLPPVSDFSFVGCQTEPSPSPPSTLNGSSGTSDSMTLETCATFCSGQTFFGVENSTNCYCGTTINTGTDIAGPELCYLPCAGNSSQVCGGPNALSLYVNPLAKPSPPSPPPPPPIPPNPKNESIFLGCYSDVGKPPGTTRTLDGASMVDETSLTTKECESFCSTFLYFGTEYSHQWYVAFSYALSQVDIPQFSFELGPCQWTCFSDTNILPRCSLVLCIAV